MATPICSDDGIVTITPSDFAPMLAAALRSSLAKPPRKFRDWLLEEVRLPRDGGPHQGKRFRFSYQPIAELWANEIDSGRWSELIYSGPSQSGKSLIGYVLPFVWHVAELVESVGFCVPMEEMASDKWICDLKPVFEASAYLKQLLPRSGPGSAGGTIRDSVRFSHGPVAKILTAGGRDQAKAGITLRTILITEAAAFSRSSSKSEESSPYEQVKARQRATKTANRRTYVEGTKTVADELPASLWPDSSRTRLLSPCPHCGAWIAPTRANLLGWESARTEVEAAELAAWHCPACGEAIDAADRLQSLAETKVLHGDQTIDKRGNVTGELPKTRRLFFDYGAWHNAFLDAGDLAVDLWSAEQLESGSKRREQAERKLCQFVFGVVYDPPAEFAGEILEEADFETKSDRLPRGIVPRDTLHLCAGVDVGEKEVHWVQTAVRPQSLHIADFGVEKVPTDRPVKLALLEVLIDLFTALAAGLTRDGGGEGGRILPTSIYCDSGYLPEVVFAAAKFVNGKAPKPLILPVLGRGETQLAKRRYSAPTRTGNVVRKIDPDRRWHLSRVPKAKIDQLTIDADHYKRLTDSSWRTAAGLPGSITLLAATEGGLAKFVKHQINEQYIVTEVEGAAPVGEWKVFGPNHYKDALAYSVCGATRAGYSATAPATKTKTSDWVE